MYVSPRPTDSLRSLPTQKFLFEFPIEFFFISGISVIVISVSAFYYSRNFCWYQVDPAPNQFSSKSFRPQVVSAQVVPAQVDSALL